MIASGKGILGTNREYLVQLATQLDALGIERPSDLAQKRGPRRSR